MIHEVSASGWRRRESGLFVPPNSDSLVAWYGLFAADTGTQATWADQSGLSNDLTETTAGSRPTTTGAGHPSGTGYGLLLDNVDDTVNEGGATVTKRYRAMAGSWKAASTPTVETRVYSLAGAGAFRIVSRVASSAWRWNSNGGSNTNFGTLDTNYHYFLAVEDTTGGVLDIWLDGTQVVTGQSIAPASTSRTLTLQVNTDVQRYFWHQLVWESDSSLTFTAPDLTNLWTYLDAS